MTARSSWATIAAIAVCAYVASDLIHEVLGHGTASWLTPGVRALSLSSVALQTSGESRFVSAAGSIANVVAGILSLVLARRRQRFDALAYFLLLLGATNLLNGTGYLLFSASLDIGDWAQVVRGWEPAWAWRAGMAATGALTYTLSMVAVARAFARSGAAPQDLSRLLFDAYMSGGLLLVAAAAMNPIDPMLILTSGASAGFGAPACLLAIPSLAEKLSPKDGTALARSVGWITGGIVVGLLFVFVVGRGIRF